MQALATAFHFSLLLVHMQPVRSLFATEAWLHILHEPCPARSWYEKRTSAAHILHALLLALAKVPALHALHAAAGIPATPNLPAVQLVMVAAT